MNQKKNKIKNIIKKLLPIISLLAAYLVTLMPDSEYHVKANRFKVKIKPYYTYFILILLAIYLFVFTLSFFIKKVNEVLIYKAAFYAGAVLVINIINLVISKYALLPVMAFPTLDRVFSVFILDKKLLIECITESLKLLVIGFVIGGGLGFITGLLIGFNKKASYWLNPFIKVIGPIPATSWSPLLLSLFTKSYYASVFMVALAVWFPVTLMTSSGIANVKNSYFEVASTLGASKFYKIFKVGVPAAMPSIFLGLFYATCGSFVALISAELFGNSAGIGWYISYTKDTGLYANVYAGLIILALICYLVITLVFRLKDRILVWQKGVIKW